MQIDRSNYEIWIIDWLDGNLNSFQIEQLELFLANNPDLGEEVKDLATVSLSSSVISYPDKEQLKKSPTDISPSQFEYLCAAYLENDLTVSQEAELREIINTCPDKKKIFDQIHKTKLVPGRIVYKHKSILLKRTTAQKAIRLSVIGLSAAAAISTVITIYSVIPANKDPELNSSARNIASDTTLQRPFLVKAPDRNADKTSVMAEKKRENRFVSIDKEVNLNTIHDRTTILTDNSPAGTNGNPQMTINKVPVFTQVVLGKGIAGNTLVASNQTGNIPVVEDERSRTGRFISKTFREKLLKDKTPHDDPLKGYEIAGAGVAGLNKLFGWEMALDMKNDEDGQPKSFYFSSKVLKINAPVKKREPQP